MPVATSTELNPGLEPLVGARVIVRLITSPENPWAPGYVPSDGFTVADQWETTTDEDGVWSTPDVPSTDDVVPANSVYVADIIPPNRHTYRHIFLVPDSPGPHRVEDNLADPPADMPSLLSDLIAAETAARIAADAGLQAQVTVVAVKTGSTFAVESQAGWDPIAASNDTAYANALVAAGASGGIVLMPALLKLASAHTVPGNVGLKGRGPSGQSASPLSASRVVLTAANAGIRRGSLAGTADGGTIEGLRIDGQNIATNPLYLGIVTAPIVSNVDIVNALGPALLLEGTQNGKFTQVNIQYAQDCMRLDRGASSNDFDKCELGNGSRYGLNIDQSSADGPGFTVPAYPHNNIWRNCIVEYSTVTTLAMVRAGSGINNVLDNCNLSSGHVTTPPLLVNNSATATVTTLELLGGTLQQSTVGASSIGIDMSGVSSVKGSAYVKFNGMAKAIRATGASTSSRFTDEVLAGVTTWIELAGGALYYAHTRRLIVAEPVASVGGGAVTKSEAVFDSVTGAVIGYRYLHATP